MSSISGQARAVWPDATAGDKLPEVPSGNNWRTTDQDEINRRKVRAAKEPMRFTNLTPEHPVFSNFSVASASGQTYQVELRSLSPLVSACTCVDFRVNGLGTCKHVEGVLRWLRNEPLALGLAEDWGSARIDLVPDTATGRLMVERNLNLLPSALRGFFDVTGLALPEYSEQEILTAFEKDGRNVLRVSQEVAAWIAQRQRNEERIRRRRDYEQQVRSGRYPAQETKLPLLPYQREGMLHLAFTERAMLADEMGLGKTAQAVAAAALLHRLGHVQRVLVVAPASLKTEWEEQIRLFTDLSFLPVFGDRSARKAAYERPAFFTLTNYEQIVRDAALINAVLKPDCVILDEAQRIKNWDTQTAQAVKKLQSRYAFVLTGTPLENRIDEIYSLMSMLDPQVLGPLFRFNRDFYVLNANGRPEGYKNLQLLRERIKPYLLRRRKVDVEKELPDRTDRTVFVTMEPEQRARYAVHEERVARLVAQSHARALSKAESDRLQRELSMMRMLCDTPYILDDTCRVCPKLDEIQSLLESALSTPDVKVLVFSEWERMLQLVHLRCTEMGVTTALHTGSVPQQRRRQEIQRFKNDTACRVFLSTDTGGLGLNLQQASVVIHCDLPWNPARLEQRVARAWRKHQMRSVTVVNLVTEDSIEARMIETLARKRSLTGGVLDGDVALDEQPIGTGRQGFLRQLASMVPVPAQTARVATLPSAEALRAVDPELGFAAALAERLGDALRHCEICRPASQPRPVLWLVADGDLLSVAACAERVRADWFGNVDARQVPVVEVVGSAAYEAIKRLQARGVLARASGETRTLFSRADGLAQPRVAPESDKAQAQMLRREALLAYRRARQAIAALAFDAARKPLEQAVLLLARAYALHHGLAQPESVRQALSDAFAALWGDTRPVLGELLEEGGSPVAVSRALMPKFGG
ncbi:MAG TPA: DEAD/DEAH box helicase [Kiritimatiellia bacterium]|nr:DEAD/DEAH box helicase [Kiritimatiellia bacterium]HRU69726.1 DEAD/DEAH box helicase [Kiritimatiellia bacterium]